MRTFGQVMSHWEKIRNIIGLEIPDDTLFSLADGNQMKPEHSMRSYMLVSKVKGSGPFHDKIPVNWQLNRDPSPSDFF